MPRVNDVNVLSREDDIRKRILGRVALFHSAFIRRTWDGLSKFALQCRQLLSRRVLKCHIYRVLYAIAPQYYLELVEKVGNEEEQFHTSEALAEALSLAD